MPSSTWQLGRTERDRGERGEGRVEGLVARGLAGSKKKERRNGGVRDSRCESECGAPTDITVVMERY